VTFSRRPDPRFNRGRIATAAGTGGGPPPYVPPAYPPFLDVTGGTFYWITASTDPANIVPLFDSMGCGNLTGVNTTLEPTGWAQPEGASASIRNSRAGLAYCVSNNATLAGLATGDDTAMTFSIGVQNISVSASDTIVSWSNTGSTLKRTLGNIGSGGLRWTQQSTTVTSGHNATNLLQQMIVLRQINNGAGTTTDITRQVEADPSGSLTANVGVQTTNVFTVGCLWNGGSGPVNHGDFRWKWLLILPSGVTLTTAQEIQLENWVLGAYNEAPVYTDDVTEYLLHLQGGQSNCACNGVTTGAITGMPDATVQTWWRNTNNDADNPIARRPLDRRPGANGYSSYAQFLPGGTFQVPHHMVGVGQGATAIASFLGTTNNLQGLYATTLHSEMRRAIHQSKARFGGAPIIIFDWSQGENDVAAGAVVSAAYQGALTTLEADVRAMVNAAWGDSTFPFHVLQLSTSQTGGGMAPADLATVQAGVVAWAGGAANRYESNTDSVTQMLGDNLHFALAGNAARAAIAIAKFKAIDARL
jgi:hypothetical protein